MSTTPLLHTLHLAHLPPNLTIHIAQYTNLLNAAALHARLLASSSNPPPTTPTTTATTTSFECALIDATTLLSPTHLYAAIFRACTDSLAHRLRTRNVHSEIVFGLGHTNNIAATLRGFGLGEGTRELVVVRVCSSVEDEELKKEEMERWLRENVQGEAVAFGEEAVRRVSDVEGVRRRYKIGERGAVKGRGGGKEAKLERRRRRKEGKGEGEREVGGAGRRGEEGGKGMEVEVEVEAVVDDRVKNNVKGGGDADDNESERRELEMQVLGLMALRGAV